MLYGIDTRWHGKGVTFSGSPSLTQLNHHIHLHSPLPSCHKHRHTNHGKGFITLVQQKHHSSLTSRFTFTFSHKTNTHAKTSVNCSPLSPSLSELWQPPPSSNVSCATTFAWPTLPLESLFVFLLTFFVWVELHVLRRFVVAMNPSAKPFQRLVACDVELANPCHGIAWMRGGLERFIT